MSAPSLPDRYDWPARTVEWFEMWRASEQAKSFTPTDWDFLIDTALVHAAFWGGDVGAASELRIRMAKFGATPEDRERLKGALVTSVKEVDVLDEITARRSARRARTAKGSGRTKRTS